MKEKYGQTACCVLLGEYIVMRQEIRVLSINKFKIG
jgi:hypothetical protein